MKSHGKLVERTLSYTYVCATAVAVFLAMKGTRFVHPNHNAAQSIVMKMLLVGLVVTMASVVALYIARWRIVGRPAKVGAVLKFLLFPSILLYSACALGRPGEVPFVLMAVLFVLFGDPLRLSERATLELEGSLARQRASRGHAPVSESLHVVDFFVFAISIVIVLAGLRHAL
jgi:hypothetical protein